MKLTIPIKELGPGMFVLADVLSILVDNEIRHFLDFRDAESAESSAGRIRLMQRKYTEVANSGGMLIKSGVATTAGARPRRGGGVSKYL